MQRPSIRRSPIARIAIVLVASVALFGFATNYRSTSNICDDYRLGRRETVDGTVDAAPVDPVLPHHPYDNLCRFPMSNVYATDLISDRISERMRQHRCPIVLHDMATMDSEGYMYVHPRFTFYPAYEENVACRVVIIEGGLRNKTTGEGKNDIREVAVFDAPFSERFWVNADVFLIRCMNSTKAENNRTIWEKPFAGIRDVSMAVNTIKKAKDTESFDKFGRILRPATNGTKPAGRYSIDILGFDSASRTMFFRHAPRTVETMHKLGYHFFFGYNKVGDNSMVNLAPILIGDVPEALQQPKLDDAEDINAEWILPSNKHIDPSTLKFLWKIMKEKFGCQTLFNEDISRLDLGLFNYPPMEFKQGFTESPADHYYRAFYIAFYQKWVYGTCRDGKQPQAEFVDLWRRFATRYRDICHFGFSFITTLTHEAGLMLETIDELVSSHLVHLASAGALDNAMSIIMGDHGNRISVIQYTYSGRIEERMPLLAIRLPNNFKKKYPKEYKNFLGNKYKLTSNFDVHQMLKDVVLMRLGDDRAKIDSGGGRGISLFDEIPTQRTCRDAYISENFCTCLVNVSDYEQWHWARKLKAKPLEERKEVTLKAVKAWFTEEKLDYCVKIDSLQMFGKFEAYSLNRYARYGLRRMSNLTTNAEVRKDYAQFEYVTYETRVSGVTTSGDDLRLLVRVEDDILNGPAMIVFEPFVRQAPLRCTFDSILEVCACLFPRPTA